MVPAQEIYRFWTEISRHCRIASLLSRCLDSSLERERLSLPLLLNGLGLRSPSLPLLLNGLGLRLDDRGGGGGATLLGRPPSSKYLPGGEPPGERERSLL